MNAKKNCISRHILELLKSVRQTLHAPIIHTIEHS